MTYGQWLETALSVFMQVAVVVGITALVSRTMRTALGRDRLWSVCFVMLALIPLVDVAFPHLRLIPNPLAGQADAPRTTEFEATLFTVVLSVWWLGAATFTVRLVVEVWKLTRLFRTASPVPATFVEELRCEMTRNGTGLPGDAFSVSGRPVRIFFSDALRLPSCCQLLRPSILLSKSVASLPLGESSLVVRHELEHLHAWHPLMLFVQRAVEIVFWMHPAVWWAARQADRAREFRCDEAAVTSRESAVYYLRSILSLAPTDDHSHPPLHAALGFGAECALIVERAERLAAHDWTRPTPFERRGRVAVPALCAAVVTLLLWVPIGTTASRRSLWSPWPGWSATILRTVGLPARDHEVDAHRLNPGEFHRSRTN